jgi:DNA-binding NarL/FixJ family response regulator
MGRVRQELLSPDPGLAGDDGTFAVVVVDDSAHFLRDAAGFLRAHGMSVVGAFDDGAEAVARVADLSPDVALVDLRMRGLPGWEAIRGLRALMPSLAIVAVSLTPAYRRTALAAGADEFVDKATFEVDLLPAIHRAAGRHRAASPPSSRAEDPACRRP